MQVEALFARPRIRFGLKRKGISMRRVSRISITCGYCQNIFTVPKYQSDQRFCSMPCARKGDGGPSKPMVEKVCQYCQKAFSVRSHGATTERQRFCGRFCARRGAPRSVVILPKICQWCQAEFLPIDNGKRSQGRKFCSTRCTAFWRTNQPGWASPVKGMTWTCEETRTRISIPQQQLAQALGLMETVEYKVYVEEVREQFAQLPKFYRIDIADAKNKIAIEVDGKSHQSKRQRVLDPIKDAALSALGWKVCRFSNEEILNDLPCAVAKVQSCMI